MNETRQQAEDMLKAINEGSGSSGALIINLLVLLINTFTNDSKRDKHAQSRRLL